MMIQNYYFGSSCGWDCVNREDLRRLNKFAVDVAGVVVESGTFGTGRGEREDRGS